MKVAISEHLEYLVGLNGSLTPDLVVDDARSPDSPLHGEFNWDVDEAAQAHWIDQARRLIRSVKVVITTESREIKVVAYVRDPSKDADEQGYVSVVSIRNDKDAARDVLVSEFNYAGNALRRAQRLSDVFDIKDEITEVSEKIQKMSDNVATG